MELPISIIDLRRRYCKPRRGDPRVENHRMPNRYGFDGRVALVTGGASGIGASTVERLHAGGAEVHIYDVANGEDVRDSGQLQAAVDRLPRLDVLVCAAGVAGDNVHTEEVTDDEWSRVLSINLNGVFYANRAAVPKMKARGYGPIGTVAWSA